MELCKQIWEHYNSISIWISKVSLRTQKQTETQPRGSLNGVMKIGMHIVFPGRRLSQQKCCAVLQWLAEIGKYLVLFCIQAWVHLSSLSRTSQLLIKVKCNGPWGWMQVGLWCSACNCLTLDMGQTDFFLFSFPNCSWSFKKRIHFTMKKIWFHPQSMATAESLDFWHMKPKALKYYVYICMSQSNVFIH